MEDTEKSYEALSDENAKRYKLPEEEEAVSAASETMESDEVKPTFCCPAPACGAAFGSSGELDSHYINYHRYQCSQCQQSFIYDRLLDIHLDEAHDSFFAVMALKKPSYACYVPGCAVLSKDNRARTEHMCKDHHYTKELVAAMHNPVKKKGATEGEKKKDKENKTCHFFNSKAGCRSGSDCRFVHKARSSAADMDVDSAADALAYAFEQSLQVSGSVKFGRRLKKTLCE